MLQKVLHEYRFRKSVRNSKKCYTSMNATARPMFMEYLKSATRVWISEKPLKTAKSATRVVYNIKKDNNSSDNSIHNRRSINVCMFLYSEILDSSSLKGEVQNETK